MLARSILRIILPSFFLHRLPVFFFTIGRALRRRALLQEHLLATSYGFSRCRSDLRLWLQG